MPNPPHPPRLLRLGGERRGEEAASYRPKEGTSVHNNPRVTADLGGTGRGGQRVELTPTARACGLRFVPGVPAPLLNPIIPLLPLQPLERAPAHVERGWVLGHEPLVAA